MIQTLAVLAVPPVEIDLKSVPFKGEKDTTLTLYSIDKPFVISSLESSCTCTKVKWSRRPVALGDSTIISITYRGLDRGMFYKLIDINSSDTTQPRRIILRGVVE